MKTRKVWLFSVHMLPLLARLCAAPHATLLAVNTLSAGLTAAGVGLFLLSNLFVPYRLARAAYWELLQLEVRPLLTCFAPHSPRTPPSPNITRWTLCLTCSANFGQIMFPVS